MPGKCHFDSKEKPCGSCFILLQPLLKNLSSNPPSLQFSPMYCFIFLLIFFIILGQSYKFSIHSSKYIIRTNIIGRYNCKIDDSGGGDGETPFLSALKEVFNEVGTENNFFFPGHCGGKFSPKSLNFLKNKINDEGSGDFFLYDLPELDGLDNIHCPEVC